MAGDHDTVRPARATSGDDAATAMRFLAVKAAIFILVPLIAAVVAVLVLI